MPLNLNWADDPIVKLEKAIMPALWVPLDIVLMLRDSPNEPIDIRLLDPLSVAAELLATGGAVYLKPTGARIDGDGLTVCASAASTLRAIHQRLAELIGTKDRGRVSKGFVHDIQVKMRQQIEDSIDVFRREFLSMVLARQAKHAEISGRSNDELSRISKQIYFVAINASVEAARIGQHGAGFAQISQEMRELSRSAQGTIRQMRVGN